MSDWLIDSQQVQSSAHGSTQQNLTGTQSDMDLASENSETNDNIPGTDTTTLLLEIRRDVKTMNKKFDHLEKSVRTLKQDSKLLK